MTPEPEIPELAKAHRVSVVIVTHNRAEYLRSSLESLGLAHQVLVVDNGSTDGTAGLEAEFPEARFIRLPKNFGLTKALNIGARAADGSLILFLHDDTRITGDAVTRLADFLDEHSDVGAVAPRLVDEQGKGVRQLRSLPSPANPDPGFEVASGGEQIVAACVSGAALMLRSAFFKALRGVDERYGTYGSDAELSVQVKRANRKLIVLRDITAIHAWADSPVKRSALEGDRAHGVAAYIGKHSGFMAGMVQRLKAGLLGLLTFRFSVVGGAFSGIKIDGTN